jgi:hypothetical protein
MSLSPVDAPDQPDLAGQEVDGPDATGGDGPYPVGQFVVDVVGGSGRSTPGWCSSRPRIRRLRRFSRSWTLAFTRIRRTLQVDVDSPVAPALEPPAFAPADVIAQRVPRVQPRWEPGPQVDRERW